MSRDKKDERNRKERERRRKKKALAVGNQLGHVHVPFFKLNECFFTSSLCPSSWKIKLNACFCTRCYCPN
jgi:hypothetical protein